MFRIYASYSTTLNRTGHSLKSMTMALKKARQLSFLHPLVEVRRLTSKGTEELIDTFIGGAPVAGE